MQALHRRHITDRSQTRHATFRLSAAKGHDTWDQQTESEALVKLWLISNCPSVRPSLCLSAWLCWESWALTGDDQLISASKTHVRWSGALDMSRWDKRQHLNRGIWLHLIQYKTSDWLHTIPLRSKWCHSKKWKNDCFGVVGFFCIWIHF